jgi:excisionase family DNA binding protein
MECEADGSIDLETAARLLGVHYQTAYRWVRTGFLPAVKEGGGYRLAPTEVEGVANLRRARRPLAYTGRPRDWDRMREQLHTALVTGDDTAARRVFEMVHLARVPILDQCEQLLSPGLRRIGDEWEAGELSGARVRIAAGICERALDWAVGRLEAPDAAAGTALVVTPKGEDHRLPCRMAGAVLRDAGWAVRGIDGVAASEVADLARRMRPTVVVVSVTLPETADAAADVRADLREVLDLSVFVGGAGKSLTALDRDARAVRPRS